MTGEVTAMRRALLAAVLGLLFGSLTFGAAASLDVDGSVLQAGQDADLTCQTDELEVRYFDSEGDEIGDHDNWSTDVSILELAELDEDCFDGLRSERVPGEWLKAEVGLVVDGSLNRAGTVTAENATDRRLQALDFEGDEVPVEDIEGVKAFIYTDDTAEAP